jgi:glycosyltransferase involved in cell wall biosynthesis
MSPDYVFLSILIPSYQGESVVRTAIESALVQKDLEIEVILSLDGDLNVDFYSNLYPDKRLRIFGHQNRLGMLGNYNFLLGEARGEWITVIGQDDALLPFATKTLRKSAELFPKAEILTSRRAYMFWPNPVERNPLFRFIVPLSKTKLKLRSTLRILRKIERGFIEYSEGPQLYTGSFVKRSLVERISALTPDGFYSYPIPDVSSAVNLLTSSENYVYSKQPLFLIGTSALSTGSKIELILKDPSDITKLKFLSESFLGSLNSSIKPGLGIFTDKTFYFYEALLSRSNYKGIHRTGWALASLRITIRLRDQDSRNKHKVISEIAHKNGIGYFDLLFKTMTVRIVRRTLRIFRLIFGLINLLSGKLIIVSRYSKKTFDPMNEIQKIDSIYHKI